MSSVVVAIYYAPARRVTQTGAFPAVGLASRLYTTTHRGSDRWVRGSEFWGLCFLRGSGFQGFCASGVRSLVVSVLVM